MSIGAKIRQIREKKGLSQGDIERVTGLLRCYTSRVENGHTVPSIETIEKFASAFEMPVYQLFYNGEEGARTDSGIPRSLEELAEGDSKESLDARFLLKFRTLLNHITDSDRQMLLTMARKLATH